MDFLIVVRMAPTPPWGESPFFIYNALEAEVKTWRTAAQKFDELRHAVGALDSIVLKMGSGLMLSPTALWLADLGADEVNSLRTKHYQVWALSGALTPIPKLFKAVGRPVGGGSLVALNATHVWFGVRPLWNERTGDVPVPDWSAGVLLSSLGL